MSDHYKQVIEGVGKAFDDKRKKSTLQLKTTMHKTNIFIPEPMMARLRIEATKRGVSVSEVVRESISAAFQVADKRAAAEANRIRQKAAQ